MDLKTLEDFIALAELRSFSGAARARHVTQPAFSRRIQALESWVGAVLVDRSAFPVRLTAAGAAFLDTAQAAVAHLERGRAEACAAHPGNEPTLCFAVPHSLAVSFLPDWWAGISGALGEARVRALADDHHRCVRSFLRGRCDFLLCYHYRPFPAEFSERDYPGRCVQRDRLVPVVADGDHSAPLRLPGTAARPIPYLGYGSGAFFQRVVDHLVATRGGAHLRVCHENALSDALRAQALGGQGLAWLPERLVSRELEAGRLVPAGGADWQATLEIWLYRSARQGHPALERLWSLVEVHPGESG